MGLDMYLTKRIYVGAEYEHRKVKANIKITVDGKSLRINPKKISYIEEAVGYWRKANHIHAWFVQNVQNGEDDCGRYYVSEEQLRELLAECEKIKNNKDLAPELLPIQEGFFFGGTEYDKYYFQVINYTIKLINSLLKQKKGDYLPFEVEYSSSW